jgi:hypothetical protein
MGRSMASFIKNRTFDCEDALRVARFWAAALVSDVDEESTAERAYVEAPGWGGPIIWFGGGRGPTTAPNQVHLDAAVSSAGGAKPGVGPGPSDLAVAAARLLG